jgi:pimeloyl-ACP methyl ester carboxylesterase
MPETEFLAAQQHALAHHGVAAEPRFVPVPCLGRAHVLSVGEGPPVLLVNGIGTPGAMWAPLMARMDGIAMHAVDLPGFGLTDPARGLSRDHRTLAVRVLGEVLDALGLDRPVLVANSLGSLWSCWLALARPDRIAALVHVGCPALAVGTSAPLPMRLLSMRGLGALLARLDPPSPGQIDRISKMVHEHPLPPEIARLLLATQRLPGFALSFRPTLRTLLRLRGSRFGMGLEADELARIDHPSLVVIGRDDPFGAAAAGRRIVDALPRGELQIVDGGHAPWVHHAEQVAPPVRAFLTEHVGRGSVASPISTSGRRARRRGPC